MGKTILCADGSVTMQKIAEITFFGSPYDCVCTGSAEETIEKARETKPSLILLDVVLAGSSSYELCSEIKNDPELANVPVWLVVGVSNQLDESLAAHVKADGHISKPWDSEQLLSLVGNLLSPVDENVVSENEAESSGDHSSSDFQDALEDLKTTLVGVKVLDDEDELTIPGALRPMAVQRSGPPPIPGANGARSSMFRGSADRRRVPIPIRHHPLTAHEKTVMTAAEEVAKEANLDPSGPEMQHLIRLSTQVIEKIAWEVVPQLAEAILRENIEKFAGQTVESTAESTAKSTTE